MCVIDKQSLLKAKTIRNDSSPWNTNELWKIYKRDLLKKKAVFTNDPLIWKQFTDERNKVNNCVRKPKADNFQTDWVQVNLVNIKHDGQWTPVLLMQLNKSISD